LTAIWRNFYLIVAIQLKERGTSAVQTWRFTNRPIVEKTDGPVYPILDEISGLEIEIGSSGIANKASGTIVLKDSPGSIGNDRRFVDILERWEIVERPATVSIWILDPSLPELSASNLETESIIWAGKITSWNKEIGGEDELLTLEIEGAGIPRRPASLPLDSTYTNDPSALGKHLPVAFFGGDLATKEVATQLQAYSAGTKISSTIARYYYAMGLGDPTNSASFKYPAVLDITNLFANAPGVWVQTDSRGYVIVGNYTNGYWGSAGSLGTITLAAPGTAEYAVSHTREPGIITGLRMSFNGLGVPVTPGGEIIFRAYYGEQSQDLFPDGDVLAQATVLKSTYHSQLSAGADFWVEARFDKPVISPQPKLSLYPDRRLWFSMQLTSYVPGSDFVPSGGTTFFATPRAAQRGSNGEWVTVAAGSNIVYFDYYLADFSEGNTVADEQGRHAAYIEIDPGTAPAHSPNPDLTKLDMVIATRGILDCALNGFGTGSGINIKRADHAIRLFTRTYTAPDWVEQEYPYLAHFQSYQDSVFNTQAQYYRTVSGYLPGDVTTDDIIEQICEESALKVVPNSSGYSVWAWGVPYLPEFVFTDENCKIESYKSSGKETTINDVQITSDAQLIFPNSASARGPGSATAYKMEGTDHEYFKISPDSIATYGRNRNRKQASRFLFNAASARALGNYWIRNFDRPDVHIEFSTAFSAQSNLVVGSVAEIVSTALPAYFGAGPEAKNPSFNGATVPMKVDGPFVRAERARVHLLGKKIEISEDGFRIKYRGRLIGKYHPHDVT